MSIKATLLPFAVALLVGVSMIRSAAAMPLNISAGPTPPYQNALDPAHPAQILSGPPLEIILMTFSEQGPVFIYDVNFGDGSAHASGTITNRFGMEAGHIWVGLVGTTFTGRVTETDTFCVNACQTTENFYVKIVDSISPVPEPATIALFGLGLAALGCMRRKRAA